MEKTPPRTRPADAAGQPAARRFQLHVYHHNERMFSTPLDQPLEIGRQRDRAEEPPPYCRMTSSSGRARVIIAGLEEKAISRDHALLEIRDDGLLRVTNLSASVSISVAGSWTETPQLRGTTQVARHIDPRATIDVPTPALLVLGDRVLRVEMSLPEEPQDYAGLDVPTMRPEPAVECIASLTEFLGEAGQGGVGVARLIRALQSVMGVFQSAASAPDFLYKAAQAVVQLVGLDNAAVLRRERDRWRIEAVCGRSGRPVSPEWGPSQTILDLVLEGKRTFRRMPNLRRSITASLAAVDALVASPILNPQGEVIGAMYGDRRGHGAPGASEEISEAEAVLTELLACGVAAGLARLEQEQAALRARVQFEQFFTPELTRQLEAEPDLLEGKDAEISVLFCDVRGFSRISERLGPAGTVSWIRDVMGIMSECVLAQEGVLVDYVGDELIAMWGAPVPQPEHPRLACRAAREMLKQLASLDQRWRPEIGEATQVGIGVNTGIARVGNTGTYRKFKYGPLGNTVNLASRVQGATKFFRSPLLVTGSTAAQLGPEFATRRLCSVRVVNITQPVELYELVTDESPQKAELRSRYEAALEAYERRDLIAAVRGLGNLVADFPEDGPTRLMLARVVEALGQAEAPAHTVWELSSK